MTGNCRNSKLSRFARGNQAGPLRRPPAQSELAVEPELREGFYVHDAKGSISSFRRENPHDAHTGGSAITHSDPAKQKTPERPAPLGWRRYLPLAAFPDFTDTIHALVRESSTSSGSAPPLRISSGKARASDFSPGGFCAR